MYSSSEERANMGTSLRLAALAALFVSAVQVVQCGDDDPPPWLAVTKGTSAMDALVAFAANYGNEAAEVMARDHGVGATGTVVNNGKFNLRLVRCDSTVGAMAQFFPLLISPDTTNADITGYGKKYKDEKGKDYGYKALIQRCIYAIYTTKEYINKDGTTESEEGPIRGKTATETQFVQFGIDVRDPKKEAVNSVTLRFANVAKETSKTPQPDETQKDTNKVSDPKTATLRGCSKEKDFCVEATVGTGSTPEFHFEIMPVRRSELTKKVCQLYGGEVVVQKEGKKLLNKECAGEELEYCKVLGATFDLDGSPLKVEDECAKGLVEANAALKKQDEEAQGGQTKAGQPQSTGAKSAPSSAGAIKSPANKSSPKLDKPKAGVMAPPKNPAPPTNAKKSSI